MPHLSKPLLPNASKALVEANKSIAALDVFGLTGAGLLRVVLRVHGRYWVTADEVHAFLRMVRMPPVTVDDMYFPARHPYTWHDVREAFLTMKRSGELECQWVGKHYYFRLKEKEKGAPPADPTHP